MRIFSIQNMLLLAFMMCANGQVMDRVPEPLRQLLGKGTAIAMSDKFDMNGMLLTLHKEQRHAIGAGAETIRYQPYNFAEGGASSGMTIKQKPFPKEELEQALGNNDIPPAVREQVNEIFLSVLGQIANQKAAL